jgi:hypothetical protein
MQQLFEIAVGRLQTLFQAASVELQLHIRAALIGGLAVSAWGPVRATEDIDFLADSDPSPIGTRAVRDNLQKFLEANNCKAEWRVGESDDPIPLLLRLELTGPVTLPGADILWAHKRWHQSALERRQKIKLERQQFFVLHPEDLILLKLDAGGPQDLLDVQALLSCSPPELNVARLKRTASRIRLRKTLDICLREISRRTR